jgi:hypothetical protein
MKLADLLRFAGRKHFEGVTIRAIPAGTKLIVRKVGERIELHTVEPEAIHTSRNTFGKSLY